MSGRGAVIVFGVGIPAAAVVWIALWDLVKWIES